MVENFHDMRYQWQINNKIYDTPNMVEANKLLLSKFVFDSSVGAVAGKLGKISKTFGTPTAAGIGHGAEAISVSTYNKAVERLETINEQTDQDRINNYDNYIKGMSE